MSTYVMHKLGKDVSHGQWLEYRREGIGGSDASIIAGLNQFGSEMELWLDKIGRGVEKPVTEAMRLGTELEDYVARRWMEETGKKVERRHAIYGNTDYPFALANIDRKVKGENAGLECKTTNPFSRYDFEEGEIAPYYYVQCVHYMAVMGFDRMYLAVLVLGKGFYTFVIERDEDELKRLMAAEKEWWEKHIGNGEMPDPDGSSSAAGVLKRMYPVAQEGEHKLLYGKEGDMARYIDLTGEIDRLKKEQEAIKQGLCMMMGEAEEGSARGFKVTWKNQNSARVDSKKLKDKYPLVYADCSKQSAGRIFRLKAVQ